MNERGAHIPGESRFRMADVFLHTDDTGVPVNAVDNFANALINTMPNSYDDVKAALGDMDDGILNTTETFEVLAALEIIHGPQS